MIVKFIIIIVVIVLSMSYLKLVEPFVPYKRLPLNYWTTGADPLNYYILPSYNKPYRYPFKYYTSYPYSYRRYYPVDIRI